MYKALPRPASSSGLLAPPSRPLAPKLHALLQVLLHYMRDKWGGNDMVQCTSKMMAAASRLSGGVELG